jgi:hypothetical protein
VGHGLHSLPPGPSCCRPMSANGRHLLHAARDQDACLGLEQSQKGPVLGDPCFARAFSEGERAKEVGKVCGSIWSLTGRVVRVGSGGSRSPKVKHQETCAKERRTNAGTEGGSFDSHLAPRISTWDEELCLLIVRFVCRWRSELPHQIFFGTAVSRSD